MKIKHVITTLALAGLMGAGAFAGVKAGNVSEAKAANGDPTNYYLVGKGSFATEDWSTTGGVRLVAHNDDKGAAYHQLLTEGDVFKGKYSEDEWWYGYSDINSGNSFFGEAVYGNVLYEITGEKWGDADWLPSTQTGAPAYVEKGTTFPVYIKVSNANWASDYAKFGFRSYTDDTGVVYVGEKVSGDYGTSGVVVKVDVPVAALNYGFQIVRLNSTAEEGETYANKDYIWNYSTTCESNAAGTQGKFQSNQNNIYVKTTGYYDIYLGSDSKFYISDAIQNWIDGYMHMEDYDKGGTTGSTKGTGLCTTYYFDAKDALLALGDGAVTHFSSNTGNKYTSALARYNEWARINQDASPFSNSGSGSRNIINKNSESAYYIPAIIIVSISALTLLGTALVIKKRQLSK